MTAAIADMLRYQGHRIADVDIARVLPEQRRPYVEITDGRIIEGSHLLVAVGRCLTRRSGLEV
jgi:hypothetical protein